MSLDDVQFHSYRRGRLTADEMLEEIKQFVARAPERFYKVVVGSDSEASGFAALVTAVTVWRVGNGAIHFWAVSERREFVSMRDRIWQEAIASITFAQELRSRLKETLGEEFFWEGNEIHVDIGTNGPTREFVEGVVGMIRGYDFEPVIKPYAYGASIVADRHT